LSSVTAACLVGVDGVPVEVEVRISSQLPRVDLVGLPEAAVREAAARVRAAICAAGEKFPDRRITVNLAPADVRKSGPGLDLPIAVAILAEAAAVPADALTGLGLAGELALDGRLRPVRGALALTLALRDAGCSRAIVPRGSAAAAALAPGITVLAADHLRQVVEALRGGEPLAEAAAAALAPAPDSGSDLADVRGQAHAKRALEIAAAGGHALLLRGPPGSGKTMLARRLPGLLPPLELEETLEVARIHGAAGLLGAASGAPSAARPFRAPHHTASRAGLLGGGHPLRPGEISLAHRGVLFLDELPEFERRSLEALRQVLEERRIVLARARDRGEFPADFQLIAACNPCPCGWRLSRQRECRCDDGAVARYRSRLSGPLLDRIDLHVHVPGVPWSELDAEPTSAASPAVRARVVAARRTQTERMRGTRTTSSTNASLPAASLHALVRATPEARRTLARAVDTLGLTARGAHKMLRVARTIADLAGERDLGPDAVAEALGYRSEA
jgi:magnesium chelatase family protein